MQERATAVAASAAASAGPIAAGHLRSSSERSSSSAFQLDVKEDIGVESDEEAISRVPQICVNSASAAAGTSASGKAPASDGLRSRGRGATDKESKRLKRLLRNRVSAQQARERKKAYLSDLEIRATNLEKRNSELEEKLSTLQNENQMLRHILKNTTTNKRSDGDAANANQSV